MLVFCTSREVSIITKVMSNSKRVLVIFVSNGNIVSTIGTALRRPV